MGSQSNGGSTQDGNNREAENAPIPMRLPCPTCGVLHIDVGDFATKVHHTHACQNCGAVWRPAVVATVGVRFLPGFRNEEPDSDHGHEWLAPGEGPNTSPWTCCALCGVVKRTDGKPSSRCRGIVHVELRGEPVTIADGDAQALLGLATTRDLLTEVADRTEHQVSASTVTQTCRAALDSLPGAVLDYRPVREPVTWDEVMRLPATPGASPTGDGRRGR